MSECEGENSGNVSPQNLEDISGDEWTRHGATGLKPSPQLPSVFAGKAGTIQGADGESPSFPVPSLCPKQEVRQRETSIYIKLPEGLQGQESRASNQVLALIHEVWKQLNSLASANMFVHS